MKSKTNKLRNLEKNRYSILTDRLNCCFVCGNEQVEMHEIYGGSNRKISMANGFCVPLCRCHHTKATLDKEFNLYLKKFCQMEYERHNSRQEFMKLIGKSYLE